MIEHLDDESATSEECVKNEWVAPEVFEIEAGSAEAGAGVGADVIFS